MTGKELALYILQNNLEDDDVQTILNKLFLTIDEAAVKMHTGPETVKWQFKLGKLPGVVFGENIYILNNLPFGLFGGEKNEKP